MKPIFTLEYSEFEFADLLTKSFDKDDYSVVIPASRQQKYFDVAFLNVKSREAKTFQLKSSRSYKGSPSVRKKYKIQYHGWFSKPIKLNPKMDFLVLTVYFQNTPEAGNPGSISWKSTIFVFTAEEAKSCNMHKKQFYIGITEKGDYVVCRSIDHPRSIKDNLYETWVNSFKQEFDHSKSKRT